MVLTIRASADIHKLIAKYKISPTVFTDYHQSVYEEEMGKTASGCNYNFDKSPYEMETVCYDSVEEIFDGFDNSIDK